jgi:hypothetical protein
MRLFEKKEERKLTPLTIKWAGMKSQLLFEIFCGIQSHDCTTGYFASGCKWISDRCATPTARSFPT